MTGMIGARVGNWYVEAEAGRGPGGVVYRARSYGDGQPAAVKLLDDPALAPKLAAELLSLRRLDHPNIAAYLDSGTHAGRPFIASEWVAGTDAAKLLEGGRRPWPEVLSVAVQVARALKHGHNRNVLHRDLKPAHLMLAADGTVKLLAFGLARVVPPALGPTPILGSAAYLPPETAGGKPPTRRADFYSLGGLLYTLATGRPPFTAATLVELTHKQCYALPERPGMVVPDLPAELDEFVCGLMAKDPARRPATAQNLLDDLERIRGKLERQGEAVAWPAKLKPDTAEAAPLPAELAAPRPDSGEFEVPRRWWRRPAVVGPLLVLLGLAVVLPLAWAGRSSDEDELARAVAEGAKAGPRGEAERGYRRGLELARLGEAAAARREWGAVAAAFGPVPSEARWVELARVGLAALDRSPARVPPRRALDAAIAHARDLNAAGRADDALAVLAALRELTRDDPDAAAAVLEARTSLFGPWGK